MCGITGIVEYRSGAAVDRALLQRMNDTIVHRGPDDEGLFVDGATGLAMRRLAIIDVAGGHQPIANETGDVHVVFNGEIYNFAALRRDLEERGHRFRTHSDTEVIVHAYEEWGDACVERFEGMFAFALHDRRPSRFGPRVLLARDQLGKKPLYYADVDGTLVFGSELKPVLLHPKVRRTLDAEALGHYLALRTIPAPFSVFEDVRKLEAGHTLAVSARGVMIRRYWDWRTFAGDAMPPHEELVADVRRLLFRAVEKRLVSEVPLGAFLSGGLDSSAVVAIMSRLLSTRVKTFSVGFEGPASHNELPKARRMAKHLGTDHHEILAQPHLVDEGLAVRRLHLEIDAARPRGEHHAPRSVVDEERRLAALHPCEHPARAQAASLFGEVLHLAHRRRNGPVQARRRVLRAEHADDLHEAPRGLGDGRRRERGEGPNLREGHRAELLPVVLREAAGGRDPGDHGTQQQRREHHIILTPATSRNNPTATPRMWNTPISRLRTKIGFMVLFSGCRRMWSASG